MKKDESNRTGKKLEIIENPSQETKEYTENGNMDSKVSLPESDSLKNSDGSDASDKKVTVKYSIGDETKSINLPLYPQLNSQNFTSIGRGEFNNFPFVPQNQLVKDRLQIFVDSMITNAMVAESRDHSSMSHIIRMAILMELIAKELSQDDNFTEKEILSLDFVKTLKFASLLHDLGKLMIPEKILQKQSLLESSERKKVNEHPRLGVKLLKNFIEPNLWKGKLGEYCEVAREVIKYHHAYFVPSNECYFGTEIPKGYPRNIEGKNIPLSARIAAVADVFEALTSKERMYPRRTKEGLHWRNVSIEEVLKVIESEEEGHFDPDIVEALDRLFREGELREVIELEIDRERIEDYKKEFFGYLLDYSPQI